MKSPTYIFKLFKAFLFPEKVLCSVLFCVLAFSSLCNAHSTLNGLETEITSISKDSLDSKNLMNTKTKIYVADGVIISNLEKIHSAEIVKIKSRKEFKVKQPQQAKKNQERSVVVKKDEKIDEVIPKLIFKSFPTKELYSSEKNKTLVLSSSHKKEKKSLTKLLSEGDGVYQTLMSVKIYGCFSEHVLFYSVLRKQTTRPPPYHYLA